MNSGDLESSNNENANQQEDFPASVAVDYIEMLTLDANEFLNVKCVCKEQNALTQTFCKDCFSSCKKSDTFKMLPNKQTDDILNEECENKLKAQILSPAKNNDIVIGSAAKSTCEPRNINNEKILNAFKIDNGEAITKYNEERQSRDDEIGHKSDAVENNAEVNLINNLNLPCIDNSCKQEAVHNSNRSKKYCFKENCQNINNVDQSLNNCNDYKTEQQTMEVVKDASDFTKKIEQIHCSENDNLINNHNNISKNVCQCRSLEHKNAESHEFTNSNAKLKDKFIPLIINKDFKQCEAEVTKTDQMSKLSDLIQIKDNSSQNLDPKNASHPTLVLQDLLNPPSTVPNSSETAPSRHQQESAHGESCASHTSIEADGRRREQAPRCSREFAADVGANDAAEHRISQDNTADNILLTETQSKYSNSCLEIVQEALNNHNIQFSCDGDGVDPRVAKERRQHLSWGFRNGRLVFAESKSDLGDSRLEQKQVVDSLEGFLNCTANKKCQILANSHCKHNRDCITQESADTKHHKGQSKSITLLSDNKTIPILTQSNKDRKNIHFQNTDEVDLTYVNDNLKHNCELTLPLNGLEISEKHTYDNKNLNIEQVANAEEIYESSTDGRHSKGLTKDNCHDILYSKDINRRLEDSNSRLKYLEDKLKKAGIIDQNFELSGGNSKVFHTDVNNSQLQKEESSQNTCTGNINKQDGNVPFISELHNEINCKNITDINYCECKELVNCNKQLENSDNNPKNVTPTVSTFTKNHQYKEVDTNLSKQNDKLNSTEIEEIIPKYTEYSEFQKENSDTEIKTNLDSNQNIVKEEYVEGEDLLPEDSHELCQFDVNSFSGFSEFNANELSGRYDDFIEESSSEESCDCDEDEHFIVIRRSRGDGHTMANEADRTKHNPDKNNLKSLLKKSGRSKDKKSKRVVFNENKNEFFDADYIILIREECDYDEDDDEGVCTCNQHEMVRLACCEPNCNCQGYEGFEQTPPSPKFAPPIEFVDAVTLSPPEGYKDMELMAASRGQQQRGAVCRECSAMHEEEVEEEGEVSLSDSEMDGQIKEQEEKEKTDQSQQTTPTTPPSSETTHNPSYILETITMTTVTEQQILRDAEDAKKSLPQGQGSPISGILKGGRLWKQQSQPPPEFSVIKGAEPNLTSSDSIASDDEAGNKRSVRFIESEERETRDICDGAPESSPEEEAAAQRHQKTPNIDSQIVSNSKQETYIGNTISPDSTEMTLTFKLGNHVLISNNSLKPNSAVRQLFPCTKSLVAAQGVEEENSQQYLVTSESLRAFEEAKRSKLPQIIQSGETDETIKRAIERNTLRRSLIRYEPRSKKQPYKTDNSLVERIKQLTCDVDCNVNPSEPNQQSSLESSDPSEDLLDSRSSPPGEESRNSPDVNTLAPNKTQDKNFSPSSSSSSSSMSSNQNYHQLRKLSGSGEQALIMDLKRMDNVPDIQNNFRRETKPLPDIGGPHNHDPSDPPRAVANQPPELHCAISNRMSSSSTTSESRRQFLAPLTACVTMGVAHNDDYYYHLSNSHNQPGDRVSVASSGTEYSLDDIEEGLKNEDDEHKRIAPDVLVGTPSASESGDELAMFVQQDAGRIERIKKKYQAPEQPSKDNKNNEEDDEHDDYGFNRRPSVRGIKPRFSTTTEILQQIQNQLQPPVPLPARVAWPYYSESGLTDNSKQKNANQNVPANYQQYANVPEDAKTRGYPPQYRPTSLPDENLYQNCTNQRCLSENIYQSRANVNAYSTVRMNNDYYQTLPINRGRNGRPQSPPPMDMSKQYHQTMFYIPYNHIEGYQPTQVQYYHHTGSGDYVSRVSSQNQINKRFVEPVYQSRAHQHAEDHHYNPNMMPPVPPKTLSRVSYPNGQPPAHMMGSRSESPLPGQFSTARATQTPAPTMSTCGYYPSNSRYRPATGPVWQGEGNYAAKVNRHSFPMVGPRYPPADSISLTDSDSQHSGSLPNGYRQSDISSYVSKDSMPNSPTKPRFIERGVPEGAASVSPQDLSGVSQSSSSTMTSPTSPQNPPVPTNQKPLFYAMNV